MKTVITLFSGALVFTIPANGYADDGPLDVHQQQVVMTNLPSMPLAFTENRGQWDEKVLFKADAGGASFYFCGDEVAYLFVRDIDDLLENSRSGSEETRHPFPDALPFDRSRYKKEALLIKAQFVGANLEPEVIAEDRLSHRCNYFYGNDRSKWRTDVPNFSAVTYKDIWPGINLRYYGNGRGMKYDFIVNPGADVSQIRIRYDGVDDLAVTSNGDLQADTRFGLIYENMPSVYQETGGTRHDIAAGYRIVEPGVFGFEVEGYNRSVALVIDPELVYSTYIGGADDDFGLDIAVDPHGRAYITGYTYSPDFPIVNPYDGTYNESWDVFVTKLSTEGDTMLYSTFLGGASYDECTGIVVDASGRAYVTGYTYSQDFPTVNPYDDSYNGGWDVFITKLGSAGDSLIYSTFLGGAYADQGISIAIDATLHVYVTGLTYSPDYPTVNAYDASYNLTCDVFVSKLGSDGNVLVYSTFLGAAGIDWAQGIAVDAYDRAGLAGGTTSSDFPMVNPYDGSYNGGDYDAFVAKLGSDGNALVYSTFLGGADDDWARGIAVDASGQAYVRGRTYSWNFPMVNAYDGSYNGSGDVFAAKLAAAGNTLIYSTFLGGAGLDYGSGIAIDVSGSAYLTGGTRSSNFPTVNAYDGSYNGSSDAFVAKVGQEGTSLVYSTFLGGTYDDEGRGIAVDAFGQAYVTGLTESDDFPTANAYDATFNGTCDVFAVKFDLREGPDFCDYFPGDVNHNGMPLELADVVTMINNYRGSLGPAYICDCGVDPPGSYFPATADPNGNCVPFELGDVVTEIEAYRGTAEASGCPDCPGSGR